MPKTVKLSRKYVVGSEMFEAATFRDPVLADYREIGSPVIGVAGAVARDREAIFAYVDRLVTSPAAGALQTLDLVDALKIEAGILDFFTEANARLREPANSSSASAGDQATSTA